jgi:hypothetical protein
MPHKNSLPDTTQLETDDGTIEITLDDACMAAAVAAQTELIDMLARLILQAIEHDSHMASSKKRPRNARSSL